jgi:N-acetylmuramic acid 6-phosphate (MurNAc-6-P) etherase
VLHATGTAFSKIALLTGTHYSYASAAYRGRLAVHDAFDLVGTVALPFGINIVVIAYGVNATGALVARVVKVEGDTVTELMETDNDVELINDAANMDASGAFSSKMSVWAPSVHPHLWL